MKRIKNYWPRTKNSRNLLFFAQVMSELTSFNSWDNYRAYSLDTISRLRDLEKVLEGVETEEIKKKYIPDVRDEALWSLLEDPVVERILQDQKQRLISHLRGNNVDNTDLLYATQYIKDLLLRDYQSKAEALIMEVFHGPYK
ncbi:MAG: hypothetical protein QF692_01810 [Alphaproteobacteria bacterium]|jgi:hypothetical protein|nr:hypothetical protein [Alphaproteobacteria bacterium]